MDRIDAMQAFVKVANLGSFTEAGRVLGLTRSAISKAVLELEGLLGARLLDRTTRRVTPTEAGVTYLERCSDILARLEEAELEVSSMHDEPRGVLKVNAPMSFGTRYLGAAVADFLAAYPELRVELVLTDRFINPLEEGVDVTIRIAELADSSLVARRIAPAHRVHVASPAYIAAHGSPREPEELRGHRALCYGQSTSLQRWTFTRDSRRVSVPLNSVLCSNNADVLLAAALAGHGITELPTFVVGPEIKAGRLSVVLADYPPTTLGIHAVYLPNRFLPAKTRVFIDFLVQCFGDRPGWDDYGAPAPARKG